MDSQNMVACTQRMKRGGEREKNVHLSWCNGFVSVAGKFNKCSYNSKNQNIQKNNIIGYKTRRTPTPDLYKHTIKQSLTKHEGKQRVKYITCN